MYTLEDIKNGFQSVGLKKEDTVIIHSSYKSIGDVDGGAETVIKAMISYLGDNGTLIFPTLCNKAIGEFKCFERCYIDWDINNSPSYVGYLSEFFRNYPGVVRSNQATHSVAAIGEKAKYYTEGHEYAYGWPGPYGKSAFGTGSPWDKMYLQNINYLFIGVDLNVMTILHYVQQKYLEKILDGFDEESLKLRAELADFAQPGLRPNFCFPDTEKLFDKHGYMRYGKMGDAELKMVIYLKDAIDLLINELLEFPDKYFSGDFLDWQQRAKSRKNKM